MMEILATVFSALSAQQQPAIPNTVANLGTEREVRRTNQNRNLKERKAAHIRAPLYGHQSLLILLQNDFFMLLSAGTWPSVETLLPVPIGPTKQQVDFLISFPYYAATDGLSSLSQKLLNLQSIWQPPYMEPAVVWNTTDADACSVAKLKTGWSKRHYSVCSELTNAEVNGTNCPPLNNVDYARK